MESSSSTSRTAFSSPEDGDSAEIDLTADDLLSVSGMVLFSLSLRIDDDSSLSLCMEDDSSILEAGDCIADNLVEDDLFEDALGEGKDAVGVVSTVRLGFLIFFLALPATLGDMISSAYFISAACPADVVDAVDTGVNDMGAGDLGVDSMQPSVALVS